MLLLRALRLHNNHVLLPARFPPIGCHHFHVACYHIIFCLKQKPILQTIFQKEKAKVATLAFSRNSVN